MNEPLRREAKLMLERLWQRWLEQNNVKPDELNHSAFLAGAAAGLTVGKSGLEGSVEMIDELIENVLATQVSTGRRTQ